MDQDVTRQLVEQVQAAVRDKQALRIVGGGTKDFLGATSNGKITATREHRGIVNYAPTELVLTARAGTPLQEIESVLDENGQMLPFEPPHFGATATLGGAIASGLSGPRRPFAGAARDFVLGVRIINGRSDVLRFGGEVMKNVAGYDVSRLMTGAWGTLGLLLDVSLQVLPKPATEITLRQVHTTHEVITLMNRWAASPLPISAMGYDGGQVYVRLSGAATAVEQARGGIGGEDVSDGNDFWRSVREHEHRFFLGQAPLWRLAVPPATPTLDLAGSSFIEWGGAQRWLTSDAPTAAVREAAQRAGGHATLFRSHNTHDAAFHPLPTALMTFHRRLKDAFDPHRILNPGRMYADL